MHLILLIGNIETVANVRCKDKAKEKKGEKEKKKKKREYLTMEDGSLVSPFDEILRASKLGV